MNKKPDELAVLKKVNDFLNELTAEERQRVLQYTMARWGKAVDGMTKETYRTGFVATSEPRFDNGIEVIKTEINHGGQCGGGGGEKRRG